MADLSTREQIRAEATERIARAIYTAGVAPEFRSSWETVSEATRQAVTREATWYVDALGDLLPTGIEWGAALAPDEQPITTVVFGFTGDEDAARTWDHPVRRYTADWTEVTE